MHSVKQLFQNRKDGLALIGLSPAKAYLEGRLLIVALFRNKARPQDRYAVVCLKSDVLERDCDSTRFECDAFDLNNLAGGQQHGVLVSNVEEMELDEVRTIPSWIGLYLVKDQVDHHLTGTTSRFFMSVNGTFQMLPFPFPCDREKGPTMDLVTVGFDQNAICVVKGGSEIVKRIAKDRGCVSRQSYAERGGLIPRTTIGVSSESLSVANEVALEDTFELVDVVFGPFGL